VVKRSERPVSEICHRFEPVPQILKNVRVKGGAPLDDERVKAAIGSGEARLAGTGRLVIRASGTEPLIRVMGEADDGDLLAEVVDEIVDALGRVTG
jgi:phosphoglucosamine mutase